MESLLQIMNWYNDMSRGNPLLAMMLVPLVGGLIYTLKGLPLQMWKLIVRQTTVTMTMNNIPYDFNSYAFIAFDRWFINQKTKSLSRNFFLFSNYVRNNYTSGTGDDYRIGVGVGTHFFRQGWRLYWFTKTKLPSTGSEREKEEMLIRTFGFTTNAFTNLIDELNVIERGKLGTKVFTWNGTSWGEPRYVQFNHLDKHTMDMAVKESIVEKLTRFYQNKEWYRERGLTYKTSFLLYGPPGTGKTTLAKLTAGHFEKSLFILDLTECTNKTLKEALNTVAKGSIVLMEDIDQMGGAVLDREAKQEMSLMEAMSGSLLTMSGLLNALDGIIPLDDVVLMATTNHPEKLDAAIRRKSRIDNEVLIDNLTEVEIARYVHQMYGVDVTLPVLVLPGCEVENAFKENAESVDGFILDITQRSDKRKIGVKNT